MELKISGRSVLIDDADYELVARHKWSVAEYSGHFYATTGIKGKTTYMHRLIVQAPAGMYVDHINRNGLDNRRDNLRIVTQSTNLANAGMFSHNKTGYRGVIPCRSGWKACIKYKQRSFTSKLVRSPEEAAMIRDEIARYLHDDMGFFNFPEATENAKQEAQRVINARNLASWKSPLGN